MHYNYRNLRHFQELLKDVLDKNSKKSKVKDTRIAGLYSIRLHQLNGYNRKSRDIVLPWGLFSKKITLRYGRNRFIKALVSSLNYS